MLRHEGLSVLRGATAASDTHTDAEGLVPKIGFPCAPPPGSHPLPQGLYSGSRKSAPLRAPLEDRPKTAQN